MRNWSTKAILFLSVILLSTSNYSLAGELNNKKNETSNNKSGVLQSGKSQLPEIMFDTSNVVLKFAAISDTHIQDYGGSPSKKLASALNQLSARAGSKLDVLLISGDLTDYGMPAQVTELKRVIDNSLVDLTKTRFVFAIGNHEYYNSLLNGTSWTGGHLFKDVFGDEAYNGATDSEITAGDYHTIVNGYHFITVNCTQYEDGVKYSESDIDWLKTQLASAAVDNIGKPIFITSHPNITGTNFGSNEGTYWAASDLYNILKDYPQSVYFCGHLHFPEQDERSIWQGDFTTIGLGSTYYCSNHIYDDETGKTFVDITSGYETADCLNTSQGCYVEVDKNNNVRITRLDFANNAEIKKPWILPAPKTDKSNLLYYTPEREKEVFGKSSPVFPAGGIIKELSKSLRYNRYKFEFTQAIDSDMVYSYQVSIIDKTSDSVITTFATLSDFYLYPTAAGMQSPLTKTIYSPDSVLAPFTVTYKKDYYIKIVAVNCFGMKSEPLISNVITTGIKDDNRADELPGRNMLAQNYPNPFNPSTDISYSVAKEGFVSIKVFNVLGKEVKTLVSSNKKPGSYTVNLKADSMPGGIYFYQIRTGNFTTTRKMILLK